MIALSIINVITESFSLFNDNEGDIDEKIDKIIIGDNSNIPNMYQLSIEVANLNPNMKIEVIFKDSFIVKYNNNYCWISYLKNNENLIDYLITGYLRKKL
jgi:hypothetical protein